MQGILVVDDEEGIRRSVQAALRRERYNIVMAENGQQAVDLVGKDPSSVAIVISDFKMPGMDGIETLAAIGSINPEICRIMLTGYATLESAIQATNEGIDGFLTKPFDNNELRQKVREYIVKKSMKRFVAEETLEEIQEDPANIVPRRQEVTVLYTNIVGFSPVAAQTEAGELCALLTEHYFDPLSDIIFSYNGTIDKYIGDSVMALFGAPLSRDDDAQQAVFAALDMQERMGLINQELLNQGKASLPLAVSIATAEAVVGLLGASRKQEYSALGMTAKIAAQLEQVAQAGQILIDAGTYEAVRDRVQVEEMAPLAIDGLPMSLPVYNVTGTRRSLA